MSTTTVCARCGYLLIVDETVSSPAPAQRDATAAATTNPARCPGCNEVAWADTRGEGTAQILRSVDRVHGGELAQRVSDRAAAMIMLAASASLLGVLWWIAARWMGHARIGFVAFIGFFAFCLLLLAVRNVLLTFESRPKPSLAPPRWHLALPPADDVALPPVRGSVVPIGPLLVAPLTGRPCVAYEVGVRMDQDLAAELPSWLLLEQRSTAFAIGGHVFVPNSVRFALPRIPIDPGTLDVRRFACFREDRALPLGEVALVYTESIVVAGTRLDVRSAPASFGETVRDMPSATLA